MKHVQKTTNRFLDTIDDHQRVVIKEIKLYIYNFLSMLLTP
jgi:hypothetical protein